jgi:hypothetical protein
MGSFVINCFYFYYNFLQIFIFIRSIVEYTVFQCKKFLSLFIIFSCYSVLFVSFFSPFYTYPTPVPTPLFLRVRNIIIKQLCLELDRPLSKFIYAEFWKQTEEVLTGIVSLGETSKLFLV